MKELYDKQVTESGVRPFDNKKFCGKCHERKHISQFRRFNVFRSICNKCNLGGKNGKS